MLVWDVPSRANHILTCPCRLRQGFKRKSRVWEANAMTGRGRFDGGHVPSISLGKVDIVQLQFERKAGR